MAKAILKIDMPGSCYECPCRAVNDYGAIRCRLVRINGNYADASEYYDTRHPDCPLKEVEE